MTVEPAEPVVVERPRRISIAWVLPVLAIVAAVFLGWKAWQQRGIPVWITFDDAAGLRTGNDVVYRGIAVGTIRDVHLAPQGSRVIVEALLRPEASVLARQGAQFWIARPQVSLGGVTGLDTLIGPTYLNVAPAIEPGEPQFSFDGLDDKPREPLATDNGLHLVLRAIRRSTVSVGSPIIYRDIAVGHVESVHLSDDARWVEIDAIIVEQYAHLVRSRTRFFKANGIGVDFGWFGGLSVRADSLEALVNGAIGFATPDRPGESVRDGMVFDVSDEPDPDWLKWDPVLTRPAGE